jgi:uncharacterized RmlC-like cupin family protein
MARPASDIPTVQAVRPTSEVQTLQRLPYFVGVSQHSVGAKGLSMHLVVIPPGARSEPHAHRAGVPHEAINLSFTESARATVARNDPAEQDDVVPYRP